jgi:hypothetical protein
VALKCCDLLPQRFKGPKTHGGEERVDEFGGVSVHNLRSKPLQFCKLEHVSGFANSATRSLSDNDLYTARRFSDGAGYVSTRECL